MHGKSIAGLLLSLTILSAACGGQVTTSAVAGSPTPTASATPTGTATQTPPPTPTPTPVTGPGHLRIMAANLSSGTLQSWTPGEGGRIVEGVHPDVVLMQEFNYGTNSDADLRGFVDSILGTGYYVSRETGVQIPNGVVSRYPILESGTWVDPQVSNRGFAWAHIDIPGDVDLWAVSVHLLTSNATDRNSEASALVAKIHEVVPAGAHIAIGGDFNTSSRTESCITTLSSVVTTTGSHPVDLNGNDGTNSSRSKPYDWVIVDPALNGLSSPTVIGAHSFTDGFVADTRVYDPIGDLAPAQTGDSGASGMQHMGVVRDFDIP